MYAYLGVVVKQIMVHRIIGIAEMESAIKQKYKLLRAENNMSQPSLNNQEFLNA